MIPLLSISAAARFIIAILVAGKLERKVLLFRAGSLKLCEAVNAERLTVDIRNGGLPPSSSPLLTALMHLRDGDEDYPLMFYVWPERESDGDEPFYWRGKNETDDPWSISLRERRTVLRQSGCTAI